MASSTLYGVTSEDVAAATAICQLKGAPNTLPAAYWIYQSSTWMRISAAKQENVPNSDQLLDSAGYPTSVFPTLSNSNCSSFVGPSQISGHRPLQFAVHDERAEARTRDRVIIPAGEPLDISGLATDLREALSRPSDVSPPRTFAQLGAWLAARSSRLVIHDAYSPGRSNLSDIENHLSVPATDNEADGDEKQGHLNSTVRKQALVRKALRRSTLTKPSTGAYAFVTGIRQVSVLPRQIPAGLDQEAHYRSLRLKALRIAQMKAASSQCTRTPIKKVVGSRN
ncbi:hypothetical protein LXA43DRAFT_1070047 [Ganoderma leucocontextum]|nr:hypothetical protein LXA43DRAFT_1070047 [Ganoderma leucocontextum]